MKKTNKKILEEIIRVDHAGERGAIKIYEGQLLALKTLKQDEALKRQIEEMKIHETEHYEYFEEQIRQKKHQTNKIFTDMGLAWGIFRFWNCYLGKEGRHALYSIC